MALLSNAAPSRTPAFSFRKGIDVHYRVGVAVAFGRSKPLMRILKLMQRPDEVPTPELMARLEAVASRGKVEGSGYPSLEAPLVLPGVQRVFSTPEEIAAEYDRR